MANRGALMRRYEIAKRASQAYIHQQHQDPKLLENPVHTQIHILETNFYDCKDYVQ